MILNPRMPVFRALDDCLAAIEHGQPIEGPWTSVFDALDSARETQTADEWRALAQDVRGHALFEHAMQEPVTQRAYSKPRGYAGDAVTMDLLYHQPGTDHVQDDIAPHHRLSRLLLSQAPAVGVRERRLSMGRALSRLADTSSGAEVLSVACGHMREVRMTQRGCGGNLGRVVGLDQDGKSLREVRRSLCDLPVDTVEKPVRELLRGQASLGTFDLVYSMGLFDYLDARTAARLTQAMFDLLRPGGRLMIANFLPIPMRGYMEAFMDWWLVYRTPQDLQALGETLDPDQISSLAVSTCPANAITWLDLRKCA